MADIAIWQFPAVTSMEDQDKFFIVQGVEEHLITKGDLVKLLNGLSDNDRNKLSAIKIDGTGSRILSDNGEYITLLSFLSEQQFNVNNNGIAEIKGYHTHSNKDTVDKFSESEGMILFDGHGIKKDLTCTLSANGWSSEKPYTQTVPVEGITSGSSPIVDIVISENTETGIKESDAFACITRISAGDGNITAYCYTDKPEVDINLKIGVI